MLVGLLVAARLAVAHAAPQQTVADLAALAERFEAPGHREVAAAKELEILEIDPRSLPALDALGALSFGRGEFMEAPP